MLILTIRTDKPEAEIGLFEDSRQLAYEIWPAHRQLAETIHQKMKQLLGKKYKLPALEGIVAYQGPGSFTGLRIGLSVANAMADGLGIPIVAAAGEKWTQQGIDRLLAGENDQAAMPEYGAPPHITQPKR